MEHRPIKAGDVLLALGVADDHTTLLISVNGTRVQPWVLEDIIHQFAFKPDVAQIIADGSGFPTVMKVVGVKFNVDTESFIYSLDAEFVDPISN